MTMEQLSTVVMGDLGWISMLLIMILVINIIGWIYMGYKMNQQRYIIDDLERQVRRSKKRPIIR